MYHNPLIITSLELRKPNKIGENIDIIIEIQHKLPVNNFDMTGDNKKLADLIGLQVEPLLDMGNGLDNYLEVADRYSMLFGVKAVHI